MDDSTHAGGVSHDRGRTAPGRVASSRRVRGGAGRRGGRRYVLLACAALLAAGVARIGVGASPPTELVIEPDLLARLQTLAAGLQNEIVLCLSGPTRRGVAVARTFEMPTPRESTPLRSSFDPCPRGTLASWHNHPAHPEPELARAGPEVGDRRARRLCVLSGTDIETARRLKYPFVVVAVDGRTWCWWTLAEVEGFAAQSITPGPPAPGRLADRATPSTWAVPDEGSEGSRP